MSSTRTEGQLCTASPISSFVQCKNSFWLLPSSVTTVILIGILRVAERTSTYIHMVFTAEGFFEVALGSWPEWDLNPRRLN